MELDRRLRGPVGMGFAGEEVGAVGDARCAFESEGVCGGR